MIWQDIVISIVTFSFGVIVIPQVIDSFKGKSYINLITSILTVICISILGFTFATMNMWISTVANMLSCCMWVILTILSLKNYLRKKNESSVIS